LTVPDWKPSQNYSNSIRNLLFNPNLNNANALQGQFYNQQAVKPDLTGTGMLLEVLKQAIQENDNLHGIAQQPEVARNSLNMAAPFSKRAGRHLTIGQQYKCWYCTRNMHICDPVMACYPHQFGSGNK
jgi:hypothetical protein